MSGAEIFTENAVDGKVVIDTALMLTGASYPFICGGDWFVAIKRPDGSVDFYRVEQD